jgi:hypothetical protein
LNVTVPANERYQPRSAQWPGHLDVAGEAVEDRTLRRAGVGEHAQYVGVGVAVVDHQRLVAGLRHGDVGTEGLLLDRAALGRRAVEVEAGLADGTYALVAGELVDLASASSS